MTSQVWNYKRGRTNLLWPKADWWLPGAMGGKELTIQGCDMRDLGWKVKYCDCGGNYMNICICENSCNKLKNGGFSYLSDT